MNQKFLVNLLKGMVIFLVQVFLKDLFGQFFGNICSLCSVKKLIVLLI